VHDEQLLAIEIRAMGDGPPQAEPPHLTGDPRRQRCHACVISVEDRHVRRCLVGENLGLGGDIALHTAVAIEMVGRQVEQERDVRTASHLG
jgi:hypothetical protein